MVGEGGRQKDGHCDFIFFCTLGLAKKTGKHILRLSPFSLLHKKKKIKEQNSETLMSFFNGNPPTGCPGAFDPVF